MTFLLNRYFKGKAKESEDAVPQLEVAPPTQTSNEEPLAKEASFSKSIGWRLMAALVIPVTLETLDYTVVATAQSRIASVFNALNLQSYIGTSYLLASAVFLPFFASIADIYGRYFGLQLSLFFFLAGSSISAGAVNMAMMLVGRGIAGIGAAGFLAVIRTILSDSTSLNTNNIQQSAMFAMYSVGYCLGPVAGGYLVATSFRWVFAINIPCATIAMILCFLLIRNRVKRGKVAELPTAATSMSWFAKLSLIDWIGLLLFIIGAIPLLLALNWGPDDNWKTSRMIACLIIGVLVLAACIFWEVILERKHRDSSTADSVLYRVQPMLPLELFRSYDIYILQYGCIVSGIVMFVMLYFVSIFMTIVTGLPPGPAGVQLLYFAPGMGGGSLASMLLIKRFRQPIYPIVAGFIITTVGLGLIQVGIQRNVQGLVDGFMGLTGFGIGLPSGPMVVQARFLMPDYVAITNALMFFFRALGGTAGLAQCSTVMIARVKSYVRGQIRSGALSDSDLVVLAALYNSGGLNSVQSLGDLPQTVQQVIRDAFRDGVRWSFISLIPWASVAVILFLFLSKIPDSDALPPKHNAETIVPEENETQKHFVLTTTERK